MKPPVFPVCPVRNHNSGQFPIDCGYFRQFPTVRAGLSGAGIGRGTGQWIFQPGRTGGSGPHQSKRQRGHALGVSQKRPSVSPSLQGPLARRSARLLRRYSLVSTMPPAWQALNMRGRGAQLFAVPAPREMVVQDIYIESFNSPVIFTYGIPLEIEGTFKQVQMDQGYALKTTDKHPGPKRYTMISDIGNSKTNYPRPVYFDSSNI